MIEKWEEGYQVVNSIKSLNGQSVRRNIANRIFYNTMKSLIGIEIGEADFRLIDKKVLATLMTMREKGQNFLRGLISWMGYKKQLKSSIS